MEVGIVPGKLGENKEEAVQKAGEILDMTEEEINQKLSASYVQEGSFLPLKEISKNDTKTSEKLLNISGIMIQDQEERVYPLGAAAGHLTGYVQSVTEEDLEELREKGYHENSVVGKSGLERAYEEKLRAKDGCSIDIVDSEDVVMDTMALKPAQVSAPSLQMCINIRN